MSTGDGTNLRWPTMPGYEPFPRTCAAPQCPICHPAQTLTGWGRKAIDEALWRALRRSVRVVKPRVRVKAGREVIA